ncbi:MAG: formimidoylglutamase [Chitinophagaceae bacterium]|nr:formimidoylglutamase [Chitinophagaceae bacterium]MCB0740463.1 formimidoylglutamase [Chitinophagaceae bacterium]
MMDHLNISDFLEPVSLAGLSFDEGYKEGQIGNTIAVFDEDFPDLDEVQIVIVGCGEQRGSGLIHGQSEAPNIIRRHFYELYFWHTDIRMADVGNIKTGSLFTDSYAALKTVVQDLIQDGKTVIILGGSHDLTLSQYNAYADAKKLIEATCVDALIDLNLESSFRHENFLMEMLTGEPNFIRHYNHLAFQSYYVHPRMLETLDKLRFDCFRVGSVKESIDEMEPVIRNSHLFSFDMTAMASAFAPANTFSPNGLYGEEACVLFRYAGMSPNINTVGIYGYDAQHDKDDLTAKQISQMIWYLLDGRSRGKKEAALDERDSFTEYNTMFVEVETTFIQSKKTGRWWMQLPDKKFIACSYKDYLLASSNEIPERWLRAQERG